MRQRSFCLLFLTLPSLAIILASAQGEFYRTPFSAVIISHDKKIDGRFQKLELINEPIKSVSFKSKAASLASSRPSHCDFQNATGRCNTYEVALEIPSQQMFVRVKLLEVEPNELTISSCTTSKESYFSDILAASRSLDGEIFHNFSPDKVPTLQEAVQGVIHRLPLLVTSGFCDISKINHRLTKREVSQSPKEEEENSVDQLPKVISKTTLSGALSALMDMLGGKYLRTYFNEFVLPGTRWCGRGNQASSPIDLGEYTRSDLCCRAHDHCRYVIVAGDTKWNLHNKESYTVSHCSCDKMFHNCLTAKRFDAASCLVWDAYFMMMKAPCFEFEDGGDGTSRASLRRRVYSAPECSMNNVVKEILRQTINRMQGKWHRPGQWGDPDEEIEE